MTSRQLWLSLTKTPSYKHVHMLALLWETCSALKSVPRPRSWVVSCGGLCSPQLEGNLLRWAPLKLLMDSSTFVIGWVNMNSIKFRSWKSKIYKISLQETSQFVLIVIMSPHLDTQRQLRPIPPFLCLFFNLLQNISQINMHHTLSVLRDHNVIATSSFQSSLAHVGGSFWKSTPWGGGAQGPF